MWKKIAVKFSNTKNHIGKVKVTTIAGAWVFYFLLAVVPLCILIATALNFFNVKIPLDFINYFPEEFKYALNVIINSAKEVSKASTALYAFTVLFSTTTLITQMSKDGDFIFGKTKNFRFSFIRRLSAILFLIGLVGIIIVAGVVFSLNNSFHIKVTFSKARELIKVVFNVTVLVVLAYLVLILLIRFISPVRLKPTEVLVGGLVSVSIFVLGTLFFLLVVKFFGIYGDYGMVLSIILVFLLWVYILMVGIISGVLVTAKLYYCRKNASKRGG